MHWAGLQCHHAMTAEGKLPKKCHSNPDVRRFRSHMKLCAIARSCRSCKRSTQMSWLNVHIPQCFMLAVTSMRLPRDRAKNKDAFDVAFAALWPCGTGDVEEQPAVGTMKPIIKNS